MDRPTDAVKPELPLSPPEEPPAGELSEDEALFFDDEADNLTDEEEIQELLAENEELQRELGMIVGDGLDGVQVRISAAGAAFHAGHGAGVGAHGEVHGHISAGAKAAHAKSVAHENARKQAFIASHSHGHGGGGGGGGGGSTSTGGGSGGSKATATHESPAKSAAAKATPHEHHVARAEHHANRAERHARTALEYHQAQLANHPNGTTAHLVARHSADAARHAAADAVKHAAASGHPDAIRHADRAERHAADAHEHAIRAEAHELVRVQNNRIRLASNAARTAGLYADRARDAANRNERENAREATDQAIRQAAEARRMATLSNHHEAHAHAAVAENAANAAGLHVHQMERRIAAAKSSLGNATEHLGRLEALRHDARKRFVAARDTQDLNAARAHAAATRAHAEESSRRIGELAASITTHLAGRPMDAQTTAMMAQGGYAVKRTHDAAAAAERRVQQLDKMARSRAAEAARPAPRPGNPSRDKASEFFGHERGIDQGAMSRAFSAPGHFEARETQMSGSGNYLSARYDLHAPDGKKIGTVEREFTRHADGKLTVYHSYFQINESAQGSGAAKSMFKNSVEMYQKLGVSEISVTAGLSKGRYVWASFGFQASPREVENYRGAFQSHMRMKAENLERRSHLTDYPHAERSAFAAEAAKLRGALEKTSSIKSMQDIADFAHNGDKLGKDWMLNHTQGMDMWHGNIKMKDGDKGYERLKERIGLTPPAAGAAPRPAPRRRAPRRKLTAAPAPG